MKKRAFALTLALMLLGSASAEFYTSNEDIYYHGKIDCIAGSTFEISEEAAVQFEKLACPVCVDRVSVDGDILVLPLPQEKDLHIYGCDIQDGNILVYGYKVGDEKLLPILNIFDMEGKEVANMQNLVKRGMVNEAAFLPDGRIAAVIDEFDGQNDYKLVLIEDMKIVKTLAKGGYFGTIYVSQDGFYITGDPDFDGAPRLAKFDLRGKGVWQTKDFDKEASLMGMIEGENGVIVYGYRDNHDDHADDVLAVVDEGGKFLSAPSAEVDVIEKIGKSLVQMQGYALVNGEETWCEFRSGILPWREGYLTVMDAHDYARIVQFNAQGKPVRDWFEDLGGISNIVQLRLISDGGDVYLYADGITPRQMQYKDSTAVYGYMQQQAVVKKLEVGE